MEKCETCKNYNTEKSNATWTACKESSAVLDVISSGTSDNCEYYTPEDFGKWVSIKITQTEKIGESHIEGQGVLIIHVGMAEIVVTAMETELILTGAGVILPIMI